MKLPNDISRCDGALGNCCEIANTCRSWIERDTGTSKTPFHLEGWPFKKSQEDCKHYIEIDKLTG